MLRLVTGMSLLLLASVACAQSKALPLDTIKLPPGFAIELVARVDNARQMVLGPKGTLFVGSMQAGKVYAVRLRPGAAAEASRSCRDCRYPSAWPSRAARSTCPRWTASCASTISRPALADPPKPVVVTDRLPKDRHHGWKFIAFGPDGKLYVPVGAPCNICEPDADRYATIMRLNADGSGLETFVRGVRNTVGFDWDPRTREMWFTDNGRDWLGDDSPPDELNHAPRASMHFGFPYCHGGTISDPELGRRRPCGDFTPPAQNLGPHVASLGMRFYTGTQFPAPYHNQILIAEHGSWNRSKKIGYRVSLVRLESGKAVAYEPFARGWLQGEDPWGRPADVLVMPDGSLLVSDDFAGAIYRITYRG